MRDFEEIHGFHFDIFAIKESSAYKIFNKDFLLGLFSPNDANELNEKFYSELLYILGLEEKNENGKILIIPSIQSQKGEGTLYNAILQDQKDFEKTLQIAIVILNRILFLKLLESSLVRFNNNKNLKFLSFEKIPNFSALRALFFEIFAKNRENRNINNETIKQFAHLPYLNSSLFERQDFEKDMGFDDNAELEYFATTQVRDMNLRRKSGKVKLLKYLFEFLDSFDFGARDSGARDAKGAEIVAQKDLINSSVLGLVFEKLNGYKDGSFYTPNFITSYMLRQSLHKIVCEKFRALGINRDNIDTLGESVLSNINANPNFKKEALNILREIRICDPAVGSGHFLVSALNEMIYIYHKLNLLDFSHDSLELDNDEIIIRVNGEVFNYQKPKSLDSSNHKIQVSLFNLKKTIIENNLFGVDINQNSTIICALRLWIELLKNSYYSDTDSKFHNLETLPNIDINIKCGDSLTSNFPLDSNLLIAQTASFAQNLKNAISQYKKAVDSYKNALSNKAAINREIDDIKKMLTNYFISQNPIDKALKVNLRAFIEVYGDSHFDDTPFGMEMRNIARDKRFQFQYTLESQSPKELDVRGEVALKMLKNDFEKLESLRNSNNVEWRFAFPEVLDNDGNFVGFDLIVGNPPYIRQEEIKHLKPLLEKKYKIFKGTSDIYTYFFELGVGLLKDNGILSLITSNKFARAGYGEPLREFLLSYKLIEFVDLNGKKVFKHATVDTMITSLKKSKAPQNHKFIYRNCDIDIKESFDLFKLGQFNLAQDTLNSEAFIFSDEASANLKAKIESIGTPLKDWDISINYGIKTGYNEAFIIDTQKRDEILAQCDDSQNSLAPFPKALITMQAQNEPVEIDSDFVMLNEKERTRELIKPILRGRDIKKYSYEWANLWVINTHNGFKYDNVKIPPVDINEYPALKAYFNDIAAQNKSTKGKGFFNRDDKGITPYNLRNCAYMMDFARQKVVYSEIVRDSQFYLDNGDFKFGNFYCEATSFLLTGQNLHYLLAVLNSKLLTFCFKQFYAGGGLGEGGFRYKKAFLEKLPIPKIDSKQEGEFIKIVNEILEIKKKIDSFKDDVSKVDLESKLKDLEKRLDSMVFALYDLSEAEKELVLSLSLLISLLTLIAIASRAGDLLEILLQGFENELKESFRFAKGLKAPKVEFEGKIIYPETTQNVNFVLDKMGMFLDKTSFFIKGESLAYLNGILASKLVFWYLKQICATLGMSGFSMSKIFVERLPVPKITDSKILQEIESLAVEILESKKANADTKELESKLDGIIYELYHLAPHEIDLVESSFASKERERTELIDKIYRLYFEFCLELPRFEGKIIWNRISNETSFSYDDKGNFILDSMFMITGSNAEQMKFLIGFLNSQISKYWIKNNAATLGDGIYGAKIYIEKLPIPRIDSNNKNLADEIIQNVNKILESKRLDSHCDTRKLESKIDKCVYELYNLSADEIAIIES